MNIYKYIKYATGKLPSRIKLLGLLAFQILNKRMIGIFIDPIMGCNCQCQMCYFSDPDKRKELKGILKYNDITKIEHSLMPWAIKLQIGCGAEPTLYPEIKELIEMGKKAKIPYISLTTNGMLLARKPELLENLCKAGLSEITLSIHGMQKTTYETLMRGAKYEDLLKLIEIFSDIKKKYPDFKIRINYTVNSYNLNDLRANIFWKLWNDFYPDIIQLRPVQKLGETEWKDFDLSSLIDNYENTIGAIIKECELKNIVCIAPSKEQINEVITDEDEISKIITDLTYCYISPDSIYKSDFELNDTYKSYHKRKKTNLMLMKKIFFNKNSKYKKQTTKKLNYNIN